MTDIGDKKLQLSVCFFQNETDSSVNTVDGKMYEVTDRHKHKKSCQTDLEDEESNKNSVRQTDELTFRQTGK